MEVRVAHLVGGLGLRVACLMDAWSGSLMLDVAGFGFLVAVVDGDTKHPKPGIVKHQSSRTIIHAPVRQLMAEGIWCRWEHANCRV